MEGISVLHVDDEEAFLEISSRFLKRIGAFDISTTSSVQDALKAMSESDFDVIVSDYQMPNKDGIEFLKILKSQGSETPFILFTGKGREDVAIEALNLGATYYLQKGDDIRSQSHELASMINQAASSRRANLQLIASQSRFKRLADGVSDFFIGLDEELRVTFLNKAAEETFGGGSSSAMGKSLFEVIPQLGGTDAEAMLRRALGSSSKVEFTTELIVSGAPAWFEVAAYPTGDGLSLFARDETDRILTERRLDESEIRYSALVQTSPDAIIVIASDRIVYANPSAVRIYGGGALEDLVGKSIYDIVPPEYAQETKERVKAMVEKMTGVPLREMKLSRKDGQMIDVEVISAPVIHEGKRAIQTILRDITGRKATELRTKRHSEELQMILNSVPAMIAYQDRDGRFVRVNRSLAEAMMIPEEDWHGRVPSEIFSESEANAWKVDAQMLASGKPQLGAVTPYRFRSGSVVWAKTDRIPYWNEDGDVDGIITIADDISNLLASERMVGLQKQLLDRTRDAILITNRDFVIEHWSGGAEAIYGWSSDEVVGKAAQEVLQTEFTDTSREEILRELSSAGNVDLRVRQRRRDGSWIDIDCAALALRDERGSIVGYASINRDNTDRRRFEDALRRANQRLKLLGSVTRHDSRNQLSLLKGWLEAAIEDVTDDSVREDLRNAMAAADRLGQQIEFTAQYKDLGVKEPGWIALDDLISCLVGDLNARGISLKYESSDIRLYADPMLEKVFLNLTENSITHGKKVKEITVSTAMDGSDLIIVYEDDGIGIPDDKKGWILEPGHGEGSGYGLYLSSEILSLTGMKIVENGRFGEGVRFEIRVPEGSFRVGEPS